MVVFMIIVSVFNYSAPVLSASDGGGLVINEIMIDPVSSTSIDEGQWIEVYNNSGNWVNLSEWTIENELGESIRFSSHMLQPEGYFVIGASLITSENGGYSPNDLWYDFSLNYDGSLTLSSIVADFTETVDWSSSSWDFIPGHALERINPGWSSSDIESWQHSVSQYGDGDFGTPGTQNSVFSNGFGQNTWAFIKAFVR